MFHAARIGTTVTTEDTMSLKYFGSTQTMPVCADYALALASGFLATLGMTTVIFALVPLFGWAQVDVPIWVARMVTGNPITVAEIAMVGHFLVGLGYACLFAGLVEPRLSGSRTSAGLMYGFALWVFAQAGAVPLLGTLAVAAQGADLSLSPGWFAIRLGIGPTVFSLLAHLAYGLTLSRVYGDQRCTSEGRPTRVWTGQAAAGTRAF